MVVGYVLTCACGYLGFLGFGDVLGSSAGVGLVSVLATVVAGLVINKPAVNPKP
jgi:hypothetical protein